MFVCIVCCAVFSLSSVVNARSNEKDEKTHPLHATLDDGMLDADELCEFSLEDHVVLMEKGREECGV